MSGSERSIYWLIVGALIGFGWLSAWTIGLPLLLIGVILLFYGILRVGPRGFWAAIVAFGAIPAATLLYTYFTEVRCTGGTALSIPVGAPAGTTVSCSAIPDSYLVLAAWFALIALAGLLWRPGVALVKSLFRTRRSAM